MATAMPEAAPRKRSHFLGKTPEGRGDQMTRFRMHPERHRDSYFPKKSHPQITPITQICFLTFELRHGFAA